MDSQKCSTGNLSDKLPAICWVKEAEGSKGENASASAALNKPARRGPTGENGNGAENTSL